MVRKNNIISADLHKALKVKGAFVDAVTLGTFLFPDESGKLISVTTDLNDVDEYWKIQIDNDIYYVKGNTYSEVVSNLIHIKYTLDDEIALFANSRIKDNSDEEYEYQLWRSKCKTAVKKLFI